MRNLKFKAQPKNAFFATANQMFGGSTRFPTIAEHCFVWIVLNDLITASSSVIGSWEVLPNIWLTVTSEKRICRVSFEFESRMLLKGAVIGKDFYLFACPNAIVSIERTYQTLHVVGLTTFPNTWKFLKNTPLRVLFSTSFSMFGM